MTFYISYTPSHPESRIWEAVSPTRAVDFLPHASSSIRTIDAGPGETLTDAILRAGPGTHVEALELQPGEFYPRIARPCHPQWAFPEAIDHNASVRNVVASSHGQLISLIHQLKDIARTVHPERQNLSVYGHEIRNLLMLACTEVETNWKGVLAANSATGRSTKDYVKLAAPMRLGEYIVILEQYPWLPPVTPFKDWNASATSPTKALPWYDAYNDAKHDRETKFARASLEFAISAVAACLVMIVAQFGCRMRLANLPIEIASFFQISRGPVWHPTQFYARTEPNVPQAVDYQF